MKSLANTEAAHLSKKGKAGLDEAAAQAAVTAKAVALATAALAPNSRAAYAAALKRLHEAIGGQPAPEGGKPLTDEILAAHLQDLHSQGLAPASIAIVPAAVGYYAKVHNVTPDPRGPLTKAAMKIIRREGKGRGRGQASGIRWEQADAAAAVAVNAVSRGNKNKFPFEAGHETGDGGQGHEPSSRGPAGLRDLAGLRDAAILAVMSDGLLRVSEVVALDASDVAIDPQDVSGAGDLPSQGGMPPGGTVTIRSSKTDQEGEGYALYIGPATVKRIQAWTSAAAIDDGPLFRRIRRGGHVQEERITARAVQLIVKRRAADAGIGGSVSGHSLRVGAAQSLAAAGAGVVEMQTAGRWASPDMPGRYARAQLAARGAVARLRYGK